MKAKRTVGMALGAMALGVGLVGAAYVQGQAGTQSPAYTSSIQAKDQGGGERGEAARLAALAKIDATQAMSAALAQVPGTALKVALDNENGNVVYSVEIRMANNAIQDVKVDAGTGQVLHVDAGGPEDEAEE